MTEHEVTALDPYPGVTGAELERIMLDVQLGVPIEQSKLTYGPAQLACRQAEQAWFDAHPGVDMSPGFDAVEEAVGAVAGSGSTQ